MQKLAKALVAFQAECPSAIKDSVNPHFRSRFASLAAIHEATQPTLSKHGLAVMQFPISGDGTAGVKTIVMHESGEQIEYPFLLPISKHDAQGATTCVSYARRYGLSGALGIVTEDDDDDGNAASGRPAPAAPKKKPGSLDKVSIEKIRFAATERLKELSVAPTVAEIGAMVGGIIKAAGYTSAADTPQAEFPAIFEAVQRWEP